MKKNLLTLNWSVLLIILGVCKYGHSWCTDSTAVNFGDSSCVYEVAGCTDTEADNYNQAAEVDDGSCTYRVVTTPDSTGRVVTTPDSTGHYTGRYEDTLALIRLNTSESAQGAITVDKVEAPIKNEGQIAVNVVDVTLSPSLSDVLDSAELSIPYDETNVVNEDGLAIYYFNEQDSSWELVGGNVDADNNIVTATVAHFSTYGVFQIDSGSVDTTKAEGCTDPGAGNAVCTYPVMDSSYHSNGAHYVTSITPVGSDLVSISFEMSAPVSGSVSVWSVDSSLSSDGIIVHSAMDIQLSEALGNALSQAEIVISYAAYEGLVDSSSGYLTIAYYNDVTGLYEVLENVSADEQRKELSAAVTHFSTYALVEAKVVAVVHQNTPVQSVVVNQNGISLYLSENQHVTIDLLNPDGSHQAAVFSGMSQTGFNHFGFDQNQAGRVKGLSFVRVKTDKGVSFTKLIR